LLLQVINCLMLQRTKCGTFIIQAISWFSSQNHNI